MSEVLLKDCQEPQLRTTDWSRGVFAFLSETNIGGRTTRYPRSRPR